MGGYIGRIARRLVKGRKSASASAVERAEYACYLDVLREGMVAFDVGANVGELTLLFSRFVGAGGSVHSFEAAGAVFERLRTVCAAAGRRNVVLNHAAVADREGTMTLHVYPDEYAGWNTLAVRPLADYGIDVRPTGTEQVRSVTIDAYCREHGIERIDLLKIDIEGAELQAMLGARSMFERRCVGRCVFEFGQTTFDMGNRPEQIRTFLEGCGYRLRNVVRGDALFPGGESAATARFAILIAEPA